MNKETIFGIFIVMILTNVMKKGWKIKKINNKEYILSLKKQNVTDFDLGKFIDKITNITIESC
jgi:hypothetical protein